MRAKKKIAILFHEKDRPHVNNYVITQFADFWRGDGLEVVFVFGVSQFVPADVVIVHVDLSVVPDAYLEFASRYPVAVNGKVKDIRKSTYSSLLVKPGDGYRGKVIVKSNLNYAGVPERFHEEEEEATATEIGSPEEEYLSAPIFNSPHDYQIYAHPNEIPDAWYHDPSVVVEKFMPEMENGLYHVRNFHFLGDHMTCIRLSSHSPIVKSPEIVEVVEIQPHEEIVKLRRAMNFDYGKFDYVVHGDHAFLLDANKTTALLSKAHTTTKLMAGRRYRAKGIYSYLGR